MRFHRVAWFRRHRVDDTLSRLEAVLIVGAIVIIALSVWEAVK